MVEAHMKLAITAIRSNRDGSRLPPEEREQLAYMALIKAVVGFDDARGYKFSTYAVWCIRRTLTREASMDRMIHIPNYLMSKRARAKDPRMVEAAGKAMTVGSLSGADFEIDPPSRVEGDCGDDEQRRIRLAAIRAAAATLKPRHATVISLRMNNASLDDVGKQLGVCKERARQIELHATGIIRRKLTGQSSPPTDGAWNRSLAKRA
jgi:RNA polymerase sigma factor (sigma-70 family)